MLYAMPSSTKPHPVTWPLLFWLNERPRTLFSIRLFVKGLDAGERDAITILNSDNFDEYLFCSGDKSAIKAAAVINKTYNIISLEKLLKDSGHVGSVKKLKHEFCEAYTKQYVQTGVTERSMHKK